jgi:hypothetical protein
VQYPVQTAEEILPVPRKPRVQSGDQVNVEVDVMLAIKKIVRETIHTFGIPPVYYSIYAKDLFHPERVIKV